MAMIAQKKELVPALRFKEFEAVWEEKQFGSLNEVLDSLHQTPKEYLDEGYAMIRVTDVNDGNLEISKCLKVSKEVFIEFTKRHTPQKNDIIMSRVGTCGASIKLNSDDSVCLGQNTVLLIPKIDKSFVFTFMKSRFFLNQVDRMVVGSTQKTLSLKDLKNFKMSIPSLPEQQKIATFLSAVDKKIQQLQDKKEALNQFKKGAMQQLFSQQLRFKPDLNEVEGLELSEAEGDGKAFPDWEEKQLGEIADNISYGMNSASTNFDGINKYIRITDIDDTSRKFEPKPITSPKVELSSKYLIKEGDILFARTGASVGKSYLYNNNDGKIYFAGFLIRFSINKANPFFVFSQTLTSRFQKWVKVMSMRSGQPGINAEEYKSYKIKLPCMKEQQKIANYLSAIDQKIESVQAQIDQSQAFKKGLLQQMFV